LITKREYRDDVLILHPCGRIDYDASSEFQKELVTSICDATDRKIDLIINCTDVSYVSSAGLRAFMFAARVAQLGRVNLTLCCLQGPVSSVFEISGFSKLIKVIDTEEDAIVLSKNDE
jgi:anti-sigma B factor antagonist